MLNNIKEKLESVRNELGSLEEQIEGIYYDESYFKFKIEHLLEHSESDPIGAFLHTAQLMANTLDELGYDVDDYTKIKMRFTRRVF